MHKPLFHHVAILGLGVIGGSLAQALGAKKLAGSISIFDISPQANHYAAKAGWKSGYAHAGQAVEHADLIIFAAPPGALETLAKDIAPFIKHGAIVTDVTSVKRQAVAAIAPHLPAHAVFIPAHPIAGSEKTGAGASNPDLFKDKLVVLTPEEKDLKHPAVASIRLLWEAVGARIEYMPPALHDRLYAYVSHLPQVAAFAAGACLKDAPAAEDETSLRFMRLTRSDPALWSEICTLNADYIREALAGFTTFVAQMAGELSETPQDGNGNGNGGEPIATQLFPKIVATCLVATASLLQEDSGLHPAHYAGAGFLDMVSPATQDPHGALEAISTHHHHIAKLLTAFLGLLHSISEALAEQNTVMLRKLFSATA